MTRLILHAGFPKCGSTSVFDALKRQICRLSADGVRVLNRDLSPCDGAANLYPPLWELQNTLESVDAAETVKQKLRNVVLQAGADETLVLSTENLSNPRMAALFTGLDALCEIEFVFYFRPQIEWIPSAWKQWNLKQGFTISQTVEDYVRAKRPNYLLSADVWQETLPKMKIRPRPFVRQLMRNGDPAEDFFYELGFRFESALRDPARSNPSIDYSLMHIMMRNHARLFSSRDDNRRLQALMAILPSQYHRTNVPMLTQLQSDFISDNFHYDNVTLCRKHMGLPPADAEKLVRHYFRQDVREKAYGQFSEYELKARANDILTQISKIETDKTGIDLLLALTDP